MHIVKFGGSALVAGMATLLAGTAFAQVAPYPGAEDLPAIQLSATDYNSPTVPAGLALQAYADFVEQASGGKMKIEIYWSASLMSPAETADGIASGLADLGTVSPIYDPASFPVANWLTTLGNQARGGITYGFEVFSGAHGEFALSDAELNREFNERGLQLIGASGAVAFDLMCNTPIKSAAEFKGKRARAAGQVFSREAEAVGMIPVPLVPTEMYEAFSRGIVDCVILHPSGYQDFGLVEVDKPKFFVNTEFSGFNSSYFSINKSRFDSLPPLAQQILIDGYGALLRTTGSGLFARHTSFGEIIASGRVTALDADADVKQALYDFQESEVANMVNTAPPGVSDPQATIDRYKALIAKWDGIVVNELGGAKGPTTVEERIASWATPHDFAPFENRLVEELSKARAASQQ